MYNGSNEVLVFAFVYKLNNIKFKLNGFEDKLQSLFIDSHNLGCEETNAFCCKKLIVTSYFTLLIALCSEVVRLSINCFRTLKSLPKFS